MINPVCILIQMTHLEWLSAHICIILLLLHLLRTSRCKWQLQLPQAPASSAPSSPLQVSMRAVYTRRPTLLTSTTNIPITCLQRHATLPPPRIQTGGLRARLRTKWINWWRGSMLTLVSRAPAVVGTQATRKLFQTRRCLVSNLPSLTLLPPLRRIWPRQGDDLDDFMNASTVIPVTDHKKYS